MPNSPAAWRRRFAAIASTSAQMQSSQRPPGVGVEASWPAPQLSQASRC